MKDKVLVEVIIPSVELSYDVYIPISRKIGNVINLISKSVFELSNGLFVGDQHTALYNQATGDPYPMNVIVKDTNIRNGSKVVLF